MPHALLWLVRKIFGLVVPVVVYFFADLRSDGKPFAVKLSPDADYKGNRGFESGSKISHGCAHLGYSSSCREAAPGDAGTTGDGDDKCSDDQRQQ